MCGSLSINFGGPRRICDIPAGLIVRKQATRMETNYSHGFSNGGSNQIGLTIGLSFFTR
ncbi:MAG: hypothetical protein M3P26_05670 [Gemmatimonadota bacterium]|nr:hypothetical protein [Gemmatimonadota bacterium]